MKYWCGCFVISWTSSRRRLSIRSQGYYQQRHAYNRSNRSGRGKHNVGSCENIGNYSGSLTTSMNSLVNKKYVTRQRSETDRRVVYIQLTGKGKKAYEHHKNFHMQMTNAVIENLKEQELAILLQTLDKLSDFSEVIRNGNRKRKRSSDIF